MSMFTPHIDNSGYVGWLATAVKQRLGSGVFVICGDNPRRGGIFDYLGYPLEVADAVRALIDELRRPAGADPLDLYLHVFEVEQTSAACAISRDTVFEFREHAGGVEASYAGGLELRWRAAQLTLAVPEGVTAATVIAHHLARTATSAPEGKSVRNRIRFDLWPTSTKRNEQIERATGLGAVVLDDRRRVSGYYPASPAWPCMTRGPRTTPTPPRSILSATRTGPPPSLWCDRSRPRVRR